MKKKKFFLNRPLYLGFTILEISKLMFYSNYYDGYKRIWPSDQMKLLMCDTDSYIMEVSMPRNRSVYDDLMKVRKEGYGIKITLDCSNYDKDDENDSIRRLYSSLNARQLGAVKDEMGSAIAIEFIGFASKLYAMLYLERPSYTVNEIMKAKGCPRSTLKRSFNYRHYKKMHEEHMKSCEAEITMIRSEKHSLNTIVSRKRCLSISDDKRFILDEDHTSTVAFGHKRFKQSHNNNNFNSDINDDSTS